MNKIIEDIVSHYGEYQEVSKSIKRQTVHKHLFQVDQKYQIIDQSNSFKLHSQVGRGYYSVIVAATQTDTQYLRKNSQGSQAENCEKMVAIKKMENIFQNLTYTKQALRELKAYRLLKHPNILDLKTIQVPLNQHKFNEVYCIFQLLDSSLQKVLRSQQDMSQQHWKFFLYQLLRGLKYIHSAGIIHCNLNSKACLVNDICDLKICQLSQCVLLSNPRRFQTIRQNFKNIIYPAPQLILQDSNFSNAIDIWSTGCIFAQIINRKPFFHRSNFMLQIYCDYLGNPDPQVFSHLPEKGRFIIKNLQKHKRQPKNFQKLFPLLSDKGIDLMKKLLVFDSKKRISAEQALCHPYFQELHSQQCEPSMQPVQDLQFEFQTYAQLGVEEYRKLFLQEIFLYHSKPVKKEYHRKLKRKQSLMDQVLDSQGSCPPKNIVKEQKNKEKKDLKSYVDNLIDKAITKKTQHIRTAKQY